MCHNPAVGSLILMQLFNQSTEMKFFFPPCLLLSLQRIMVDAQKQYHGALSTEVQRGVRRSAEGQRVCDVLYYGTPTGHFHSDLCVQGTLSTLIFLICLKPRHNHLDVLCYCKHAK